MRTAPCLLKRPSRRSPGSRAKSVPTCQVLRPRRVGQALALTFLSVLPSATLTSSAPRTNLKISRLNGWPANSPVNASSRTSRCVTHDSGPVWLAIPLLLRTFTFYSLRSLPAHIAVGTSIAGCPPHRSRRAGFTHPAPTSGGLPPIPPAASPTQSSLWDTFNPAQCPVHVLVSHVSLHHYTSVPQLRPPS